MPEDNINVEQQPVENSQSDTIETTTVSDWKSSLPEDLRAHPSLQDIKDIGALTKSYVNAQQMLGSSIRIPSEDASEEVRAKFYEKLQNVQGVVKLPSDDDHEGWNQFYNRLGRPESPDKYELQFPHDLQLDENKINSFKDLAHTLGLTKAQAAKLAEFDVQQSTRQLQELEAIADNNRQKLKQDWGDDYQNRLNIANAVAESYAEKYPEDAEQLFALAGSNPLLRRILAEIGQGYQEKGVAGFDNTPQYAITPEEARERISEMYQNKEIQKILRTPNHPDRETYLKKREKYFKIINQH